MDEYFLHFLWQYQKFNQLPLNLSNGSELVVLKPGYHNSHSGPDFLESRMSIDGILWCGSVEIHYKSSDWKAHNHQKDPSYENVILHVVWTDDQPVIYADGKEMPTLVLSGFVDQQLEQSYHSYINQPAVIRCTKNLPTMPPLQITAMLDHALIDRLQNKASVILKSFERCQQDWNETTYLLLAKNFGFSVNKEPFQKLAAMLPLKIIRKHSDHPHQVEALIFGTAGLLENILDDYQHRLKIEYDFLRKKYRLIQMHGHEWRFARLRPPNFPTIRLSQFCQLLLLHKNLFSLFTSWDDPKQIIQSLSVEMNGYWIRHYDFAKPLKSGHNRLGKMSVENILINSIAPLLAAYAKSIDESTFLDKAIKLLQQLKPESNKIIKAWSNHYVTAKSAFDSQALIQQYNEFCLKKRCLHCNIGVSILNR